jgi:K+/H+ antiporter YhaU regulatory subunit KhtT
MFFSVTVKKAIDEMTQSELIEGDGKGIILTDTGRWELLRKGEKQMKKVVDDSGAPAKEPKSVTEQRAARDAQIAKMQAEIDELRMRPVPRQPSSAAFPGYSLLKENDMRLRALGVNLTAPQLLMEMEALE